MVHQQQMPEQQQGVQPHTAVVGSPGPRTSNALSGAGYEGGLTAYELRRLERIQRNQEVMLSMGLAKPGVEKKPEARPPLRPAPRKRAAPPEEGQPAGAFTVRRSTRNFRGGGVGAGAEGSAAVAPAAEAQQEPAPEPELQYDDSSVQRYVCEVLAGGASTAEACSQPEATPAGARVTAFRRLPGCLSDPALARAYSVDWRPGLAVAGGKDGVVSVWGSRQLEAGQMAPDTACPPLLSGKLHRGWVAEVQLLSGSGSSSSSSNSSTDGAHEGLDAEAGPGASLRLLTAGNDGAVCFWDLGQVAEASGHGAQLPLCLAKTTDLHNSGVFSLHERAGRVLTASKDGTVAVAPLDGSSGASNLAALQRYHDLHQGVVKCARWREADGGSGGEGVGRAVVFASCGNDRQLCICDVRQSQSAGPSLAIPGAHGSAINCLRWHPSSEHLLLTASHDPAILLHDLRSPAQPLHRFLGHAPAARISAIYQPAFVAGGAAVATGGERTQLLSLYCTTTGAAISRGNAGITPGATFCRAGSGSGGGLAGAGGGLADPLLVTASRAIYVFKPVWCT